MSERKNLFISYAWADWDFVSWLINRLTAEGYSVWYDRAKLLGGESLMTGIDDAIKNKTFCMLGILSSRSITRTAPRQEWQTALNMESHPGDFLIPIKYDGFDNGRIPWLLQGRVYISFENNWADGLSKLLETLRAIGTPQMSGHLPLLDQLVGLDSQPIEREEVLYSNAVPFTNIPSRVFTYKVSDTEERKLVLRNGMGLPISGQQVLSFQQTLQIMGEDVVPTDAWNLSSIEKDSGEHRSVNYLLKSALVTRCLKLGLRFVPRTDTPSEANRGSKEVLYFPHSLGERAKMRNLSGRKITFNVCGQRNSPPPPYYYYQSFTTKVTTNLKDGSGHFTIVPSFHFKNSNRADVDHPSQNQRRRKMMERNWRNHGILRTVLYINQFMCEGQDDLVLHDGPDGKLSIAGQPFSYAVSHGIDEDALFGESISQGEEYRDDEFDFTYQDGEGNDNED